MKISIRFSFLVLCLCLIAFNGCREDVLLDEMITTVPSSEPLELFTTSLIGIVNDENGDVISDATIVIAGEVFRTDQFGYFSSSGLEAPSTGLFIKALKEGYFTGGTHYFPQSSNTADVVITLIDKEIESFMATEGFQKQLPGGAEIIIPSSSIQRDGQDYIGNVNISTVWLDPEAESTFNTMPGALIGQDEEGESQFLQTFGMIGVEMTDDQGQKLQLKDGVNAELTFPLSTDLAEAAPDIIPLWHFDESIGIWIEEGSAEKRNNQYIASVPHFSWWNCDFPLSVTKVCLNVNDESGLVVENLTPCLSFLDNNSTFCNPSNEFCGLVPTGEIFTLELKDNCGEVVHTETIGPFSGGLNDVSEVDVALALVENSALYFTGMVANCDGNPLANGGYVVLNIDGNLYYDLTLPNGEFAIRFFNCNNTATELLLTAVDADAFESGEVMISLVEGQSNYTSFISSCGALETELFILNGLEEPIFALENLAAFQSVAETTITARDPDSEIGIYGFKGFGEGQFFGNLLFNDAILGAPPYGTAIVPDLATFNITRYDDEVGGFIQGNFSQGNITGVFSVQREN